MDFNISMSLVNGQGTKLKVTVNDTFTDMFDQS